MPAVMKRLARQRTEHGAGPSASMTTNVRFVLEKSCGIAATKPRVKRQAEAGNPIQAEQGDIATSNRETLGKCAATEPVSPVKAIRVPRIVIKPSPHAGMRFANTKAGKMKKTVQATAKPTSRAFAAITSASIATAKRMLPAPKTVTRQSFAATEPVIIMWGKAIMIAPRIVPSNRFAETTFAAVTKPARIVPRIVRKEFAGTPYAI